MRSDYLLRNDKIVSTLSDIQTCRTNTRRSKSIFSGDCIVPRGSRQPPDYHSHFEKADPILFEVVCQVGPFQLTLQRNRFRMLVGSIISQQLSTVVARTIRNRLEAAVAPGTLTPERVGQFEKHQLRSLGLSNQKAEYILDLSSKVLDGSVQLSSLGRKDDEEVIQELTVIRGIGRWHGADVSDLFSGSTGCLPSRRPGSSQRPSESVRFV